MPAKRKYPWEDWFLMLDVIILQGLDYTCSQSMMSQTIRNNASRLGVYVSLTDLGNAIRIRVVGARHEIPRTNKAAITQQRRYQDEPLEIDRH